MTNKLTSALLRLPFTMTAVAIAGCCTVALWTPATKDTAVVLEPVQAARIDPPVVYQEPDYRWDSVGCSVWEEIPLDGHLQIYIQECCAKYNVSYPLVLGLIETESSFQLDADSGWAYGLMQVGYINHDDLAEQGMDPMTTIGNIEAGVYMIGGLLDKYPVHMALMAYNCGEAGAAELWEQGIVTSQYSRDVIQAAERWAQVIEGR